VLREPRENEVTGHTLTPTHAHTPARATLALSCSVVPYRASVRYPSLRASDPRATAPTTGRPPRTP
jgi:hypothetical protein